jgi:predicted TIM-barrel fold metal-dependent hydrolase
MADRSHLSVVDADGHVMEPPSIWPDYVEARYRQRVPRPIRDENGRFAYVVDDQHMMRVAGSLGTRPRTPDGKLPAGGSDPAARLRDMDAEGIDVAVLYPTVSFFFPELRDSDLHAALCRAYNDWLADYCRSDPRRLIGVALLPLEDVDASIHELERATRDLGFRGAFFRPNPYAGRPIQHPVYDPFWARAAALGVAVTVHEGVSDALPTLGRDRTDDPVTLHLMSHPFEQMAACAGLILGGVLERHPELRVVFLESGCGWLPYWLDRMDGHWETWRARLPQVKRRPSEAFRQQCFVSMDTDDHGALTLLERLGDENLVWASDYPHTDATFPGAVAETLELLSGIPEASLRRVLGDNARRLYGIER